jgi:hypothetical protein
MKCTKKNMDKTNSQGKILLGNCTHLLIDAETLETLHPFTLSGHVLEAPLLKQQALTL